MNQEKENHKTTEDIGQSKISQGDLDDVKLEDFEDFDQQEDFNGFSPDENISEAITGYDITSGIADMVDPFVEDRKKFKKFKKLYTTVGANLLDGLGIDEFIGGSPNLKSLPKPAKIVLILAIIGIPPAFIIKAEGSLNDEEIKEDVNIERNDSNRATH